YEVNFDYLQMNDIMKLIKDESLEVINQNFDINCMIKFEIRKAQLNQVLIKFDKIEGITLKYIETT
ncbi:MAG: YigZ family protein, partial [Flavobacterium sp.]